MDRRGIIMLAAAVASSLGSGAGASETVMESETPAPVFNCPPVLLILFNRPRCAALVLDDLAAAVDWNYEEAARISEINQGRGRGPRNAISRFFSREKAGIILKDDCVPGATFFRFCVEMLERYIDLNSVASGALRFPLIHPPVPAESAAINRLYAVNMRGSPWRYRDKVLKRWARGLVGISKGEK